jgi:hypothetical protein
MAFLNGHSMPVYGSTPYGAPGPGAAAPSAATQPARVMDAARGGFSGVNGTPVRIVTIAFAAAAGLFALKLSGFKFNVGVSA